MRNWRDENVTKRTEKTPAESSYPPRYVQESSGITEESKAFVLEHLRKIGDVYQVTVGFDTEKCDYRTKIFGRDGEILVDGFSVGYVGEGSCGMQWLLDLVKLEYTRDSIYKFVEGKGSREWRNQTGGSK